MPQTPHVEQHFTGSEIVRDVVIGMSDGLTVPFALAAGLSGAVSTSGVIITAGLAEVAAGSIAMGLGGYLAARSDAEHYASEVKREESAAVARARTLSNSARVIASNEGKRNSCMVRTTKIRDRARGELRQRAGVAVQFDFVAASLSFTGAGPRDNS